MNVLVINAGSSSLKYQLVNVEQQELLAKGICERVGSAEAFHKHGLDKNEEVIDAKMADHDDAMALVLESLTSGPTKAIDSLEEIDAVGHRIVQGGKYFDRSVLIDDDVIQKIDELAELAPLHNKAALMGINACLKHMPSTPMVAVFDTSFFQTLPPKAYMYPLPYELYEKYAIRKYGAHGTSHRYEWMMAKEILGSRCHRLLSCHLGNGASITAVKGGKCVNTSMGFTPLGGIMMGGRCGDIDPSIICHIMDKKGISPKEMDTILNKKSGMLGVSGISSDARDIEDAVNQGNERAVLTQAVYVNRVINVVGGYVMQMGGVDAIAFTAGLGENDTHLRHQILEKMEECLGLSINYELNDKTRGKEVCISNPESKVQVYVVPTNEELVIARDTVRLLGL